MHGTTESHRRHTRNTILHHLLRLNRHHQPNRAIKHRTPPGLHPQPPKSHLQQLYWRFRKFSSKPHSLSFREHQSIGIEISSKNSNLNPANHQNPKPATQHQGDYRIPESKPTCQEFSPAGNHRDSLSLSRSQSLQ
ncbi:hypothetical protein Bca52824_046166 [Brassica carinata]|uniref:Uncharacterized protein n=1 Tax=Brassica carinata TaxID=52824 RepID=A0A8X7UPY3_BRACI|nr:hypothetical protein Bca52824_046166 [Brassica carinata]